MQRQISLLGFLIGLYTNTGMALEGNGKERKPQISASICSCPAHLTAPLHCRKGVVHLPSLQKSPCVSSQSSSIALLPGSSTEEPLLGSIALLIRPRPSFLIGEGNYLCLSWVGKASFVLLLHISSPPPPMGFVLCQDHYVDRSWLPAGSGAPRHPCLLHRTIMQGKMLPEPASRDAVTKRTFWKQGRRGRILLGWWMDLTLWAPSQTTPHSLKVSGPKWGQICHHR